MAKKVKPDGMPKVTKPPKKRNIEVHMSCTLENVQGQGQIKDPLLEILSGELTALELVEVTNKILTANNQKILADTTLKPEKKSD